jgi:hypothetical protein
MCILYGIQNKHGLGLVLGAYLPPIELPLFGMQAGLEPEQVIPQIRCKDTKKNWNMQIIGQKNA